VRRAHVCPCTLRIAERGRSADLLVQGRDPRKRFGLSLGIPSVADYTRSGSLQHCP
jgi:hypothetical protein